MQLTRARRFQPWHAVAIGFLAQNCALGLTYGSFGTLLPALQAHLRSSRAEASTAMSAMLLVLCLASPFVGRLLQSVSIRTIMFLGALLSAASYGVLAIAPGIRTVVACYAVMGAGICMLGIIAPTTLITNWYAAGRGWALGVVNLPIILFLTPMAVSRMVSTIGLGGTYLSLAAVMALLVPVLALIVDRPLQDVLRADIPSSGRALHAEARMRFLREARFWQLSLGMGILTAAGSVFIVHAVSFVVAKGISLRDAAFLFSAYGFSGIGGTYVIARLSDRFGAVNVLCLNALFQALLWSALLLTSDYWLLLGISCLIGACSTSLIALHGAATAELFDQAQVGQIMGATYLFKTPFIFGAPLLAGYLFDVTGSYASAFLTQIVVFVAAAIILYFIGHGRGRVSPARGRLAIGEIG